MKKGLLLIFAFCLSTISETIASHHIGGEITWECVRIGADTGKYIFQLKLYRDCNELPIGTGPQTIDVINHPSLSTIICNYVANIDLASPGCGYDCNNPQGSKGATEEWIYRSSPVTLSGVPPPSGWSFVWEICCRNPLDNVTGETNMVLRSKMFSFNGLDANPCFNASPVFSERPVSAMCLGTPFNFLLTAIDEELDSVSYSWSDILDGGSGGPVVPLVFVSPYSLGNPFPGNPVLNSSNGKLSVFPQSGSPQGSFGSVIKVEEYRCGVKISEICRDIQINITAACQQTMAGVNGPPVMSSPFGQPGFPSFTDTVFAGDTVDFAIQVLEFDINLNATFQTAIVDASSMQFGAGFINPDSGCAFPPCATLQNQMPQSDTLVVSNHFTWVTGCSHVGVFNNCLQTQKEFEFLFHIKDNACPYPANNSVVVTVVVISPEITANGDTLTTNFPNGTLQWYFNGNPIPGATSNIYIATVDGVYTVASTLTGGCDVVSEPFLRGTVVGFDENVFYLFNAEIIPNPSTGLFSAKINSFKNQQCDINITDVLGRSVFYENLELKNGVNELTFDLSDYRKGIYFFNINTPDSNLCKRLILN